MSVSPSCLSCGAVLGPLRRTNSIVGGTEPTFLSPNGKDPSSLLARTCESCGFVQLYNERYVASEGYDT